MIRNNQKSVVTRNCWRKGKSALLILINFLLVVMGIHPLKEINAADLSIMKIFVNNSQIQRIFDTNETTMLIGKHADYGPPESDQRTTYALWMMDIQTGLEIPIKTPERVIEASLSPVDNRIAYITENYTLWISNPSTPYLLKVHEGAVSGGAWSPDSSKIVFAAEDVSDHLANPDIFVAETQENGTVTQLTTHISDDDIPAWSPDGTHILFVSGRMGIASLWIMQADGNNLRQVTNHGIIGGRGNAPTGFIPVPVFDKAILWPEQGKIYFHSGDELWKLQGDQTTADRSLATARTVTAKKIKSTEFPVGLFTINKEPTLWLKEENTVDILNIKQ